MSITVVIPLQVTFGAVLLAEDEHQYNNMGMNIDQE
jgi:hypothetical protein